MLDGCWTCWKTQILIQVRENAEGESESIVDESSQGKEGDVASVGLLSLVSFTSKTEDQGNNGGDAHEHISIASVHCNDDYGHCRR